MPEQTKIGEVVEETPRVSNKKVEEKDPRYVAGKYKSVTPVRVLKKLTSMDRKNSDGTIARTYGTWAKPDNFFYFSPDESVELNEEDLKNESLRQLIDSGKVYRTLR